jgi:guanylate kinase
MSVSAARPASRLIVVSAPSGTGKTTLCARLLREIPELKLSISTTTRAPRGTEKNGVEYFFVTHEEFKKKIADDRFAEWAEVHGNFYGTTKDFVESSFAAGKSLLLDIDVQGAASLHRAYPTESVRIFLKPPSMQELERRLRARATDSEESIQKRLKAAAEELKHLEHFDFVVVNDDLERAYFELAGIVLHSIRGVQIAGTTPSRGKS